MDRIAIYSAEPLELGSELDYRTVTLAEPAAGPAAAAARLFDAAAAADRGATVQVIAAPDAERELEIVAARIRALADGGVPLRRIAVVARQARPYLDLAIGALAKAGVPATARRRLALSEVPAVRAVRSLLAAAADGWSRHALVGAGRPALSRERARRARARFRRPASPNARAGRVAAAVARSGAGRRA